MGSGERRNALPLPVASVLAMASRNLLYRHSDQFGVCERTYLYKGVAVRD